MKLPNTYIAASNSSTSPTCRIHCICIIETAMSRLTTHQPSESNTWIGKEWLSSTHSGLISKAFTKTLGLQKIGQISLVTAILSQSFLTLESSSADSTKISFHCSIHYAIMKWSLCPCNIILANVYQLTDYRKCQVTQSSQVSNCGE